MIDLARYEAEQDAEARREDWIADRAVEIARELLRREPDRVIDAVHNGPLAARWGRLERDLARTAHAERHDGRLGIATVMADLLWAAAREMGEAQAEEEWQ